MVPSGSSSFTQSGLASSIAEATPSRISAGPKATRCCSASVAKGAAVATSGGDFDFIMPNGTPLGLGLAYGRPPKSPTHLGLQLQGTVTSRRRLPGFTPPSRASHNKSIAHSLFTGDPSALPVVCFGAVYARLRTSYLLARPSCCRTPDRPPARTSKNRAWLITAFTISGLKGLVIRKVGSARSPVRSRSG